MTNSEAFPFDPYHKWLGIPPAEQPPDHYRLLGLQSFESDEDVIAIAADRQMVHIKSFAAGPYSAHSQRLLDELAKTRICLLNARTKQAYDAGLRQAGRCKGVSPSVNQQRVDQQTTQSDERVSVETSTLSSHMGADSLSTDMRAEAPSTPLIASISSAAMRSRVVTRDRGQARRKRITLIGLAVSMLLGPFVAYTVLVNVARDRQQRGMSTKMPGPARQGKKKESAVAKLFREVSPCIVAIQVVRLDGEGRFGSGVIVSEDGIIATSYRLICRASSAKISFSDGKIATTKGVLAFDPGTDVAILGTEGRRQFLPVSADLPKLGEVVFAFGSSRAGDCKMSMRRVTAIRKGSEIALHFNGRTTGQSPDSQWIQTRARKSIGSDGGPLVNVHGEIVGLIAFHSSSVENVSCAISGTHIRQLLDHNSSVFVPLEDLVPRPFHPIPEEDQPKDVEGLRGNDDFGDPPRGSVFDEVELPSGSVLRRSDLVPLRDEFMEQLKAGVKSGDVFSLGGARVLVAQRRGRLHGRAVSLHVNGKLQSRAYYEEDRRNEVTMRWDTDGEPLFFGRYKRNRKNGLVVFFNNGFPVVVQEWSWGHDEPDEQYAISTVGSTSTALRRDELDDNSQRLFDQLLDGLDKLEEEMAAGERSLKDYVRGEFKQRQEDFIRKSRRDKR